MAMERFKNEIEKNIRRTVVAKKKQGTAGMSLECLFQNTPTPKTTADVTPIQYKSLFTEIAQGVAKSFLIEQ